MKFFPAQFSAKLAANVRFFFTALILMPLISLADVDPELQAQAAKDVLSASYMFQVLGSLLLVFACIFGLVFLMKKVNGLSVGNKSAISVLGSARLGSREKIVLVQAGEQQLLVGVAPNNISLLHTFNEPIEGLSETAGNSGADFSALLKTGYPKSAGDS